MSLRLGPAPACHAGRPLPAPGAPLCAAPGALPFGLFEDSMQRRAVEGITWAALHRLLLLTGTQHLARAALRGWRDMCCCGASLDAGFSQRGRLICASVLHSPHQSSKAICVAGRRRGVSWSATAARIRAVFPSFRTDPATSLAHPAAYSAAHTVQPATRSWAHRAASTQPSAAGSSAMQSLCTAQGCSE